MIGREMILAEEINFSAPTFACPPGAITNGNNCGTFVCITVSVADSQLFDKDPDPNIDLNRDPDPFNIIYH